jgi:hypothetical protein
MRGILFCVLIFLPAAWSVSITDFHARPGVDTVEAALQNADAFAKAIIFANSSSDDRVVLVPEGYEFFMGYVEALDIYGVTVQVDGVVKFSDHIIPVWGTESDTQIKFEDCDRITLTGSGTFDGQGLKWWRLAYASSAIARPKLVRFRRTRDISVDGLTFLNSPSFHVIFEDSANVVIHDVTVFVDSHLLRGIDRHDSITYPLNTDALDIRATNVTVYNCNITNYDDAIVAKPCDQTGVNCQCSGNMLVYNNTITYSTGITIGSVSPSTNIQCVRNVTFRDNYLYRPLKAIYIKPNPKRDGDAGSGIIDQIFYENILIEQAVWWTVWIGPQQMNEPNEESVGCNFLYPFIPECPTQPLISMSNIKLVNVTAIDTLPLFEGPGVILCDIGNVCTDFEFNNVTNAMYPGNATDIFNGLPWPFVAPQIVFPTKYRTDDWAFEYISSNVYGSVINSNPTPCFNDPECFNPA